MTTKRKQILKAMAFASCTTMDDLALSTGLERKNLHDNVKASIREDLCERIRDDVTGLPAYKLTAKGRAWLENDKDNSSSVKPQPAAGENSGSKDKGSTVGSGDLHADHLPLGNAVSAPPKPDDLPVAAGADVKAFESVTDFCKWLSKRLNTRTPRNLRECRDVINTMKDQFSAGALADSQIIDQQTQRIAELRAEKIALKAKTGAAFIGYAVIPDDDGMIIHASEKSAREEAGHLIVEESDRYNNAHLVAIIDTAALEITWKNAA